MKKTYLAPECEKIAFELEGNIMDASAGNPVVNQDQVNEAPPHDSWNTIG